MESWRRFLTHEPQIKQAWVAGCFNGKYGDVIKQYNGTFGDIYEFEK